MIEDIVPIILTVLIKHKKPIKLDELVEESSCEKVEVLKSINLLKELQLVNKETKGTVSTYQIIKDIKGIQLAKAAHIGLDLTPFDSFFKVDKKEKALALELASQAEKIKHLDLNKRKPLLQKRNYLICSKTDDIYENLSLLLEATNNALYEYIEKAAEKDAHLKLLIDMHEQADSSLRDYVTNLK